MNYTKQLDKARDLNNAREFDKAIAIFENIKDEGADDAKWYYRYAYALTYMNQFKKARETLETGLTKDDGGFPFASMLLAQLYYRQGKLVEAFKLMEAGKEKCESYEPDSVWEFDDVMESMYFGKPFADTEDWRDAVLQNDFPDYDDNADREDDVQDAETQKAALAEYFGDYERSRARFYLYINGRLQPKHRHLFEDRLSWQLALNRLGVVAGGGTLMGKDKRIAACDISFEIFADVENHTETFLEMLHAVMPLPKGSRLEIYSADNEAQEEPDEVCEAGEYDIFAVGLDGQSLDDEVYENYSVGDVLDRVEWIFDRDRQFLRYYFYDETTGETTDETTNATDGRFWLRFLCNSYEKMEEKIKQELADIPLCKNALFVNETNLHEKDSLEREKIFRVAPENGSVNDARIQAQKTFKYFWRELSWERRRVVPALSTACVKIAFSQKAADCAYQNVNDKEKIIYEHMWVKDVYFDGEYIFGVLVNEPEDLTDLHSGDHIRATMDQLSDWVFAIPESRASDDGASDTDTTENEAECISRAYGGFTVQAMRAQMSEEERAAHDAAWGLDFGDYNEVLLAYEQKEHPENLIEHPMSRNSKDTIIDYLIKNPDAVSQTDEDGYTMLHNEVIAGNLTSVEVLLAHGADKHAKTGNGKTALDFARQIGWEHVAAVLEQEQPTQEERIKAYKEFWDWFASEEKNYFDNIEDKDKQEKLFESLSAALENISDGLVFEFSPLFENTYREFVISAEGVKEKFPVVIALVEQAPQLKNWHIKAFRQRTPNCENFRMKYEGFDLGFNDIYFRADTAANSFGLELYVPGYDEQNPALMNCVYIMMDSLIGEYDTAMTIDWINWNRLDETKTDGLLPLIQLLDAIDAYKEEKK